MAGVLATQLMWMLESWRSGPQYSTSFVVLCVLLVACNGVVVHGGTQQQQDSPITLLVQLSDLHVSWFHLQDPKTKTSRVEDLEVFGDRLLRTWKPDGIVITGDLTDAKTPAGRGLQYKAEWREYLRVWKKLVAAAGLPENMLMDIRGNHDSFDVGPRGGAGDSYQTFSSRGASKLLSSGTSRVNVDYIHPAQAFNRGVKQGSKRQLSETDTESGEQRRLQGWGRQAPDTQCPTLAMVSVDATPDPGLRNPTNFLGIVNPDLVRKLKDQLAQVHVTAQANSQCPPPTIISYGHHTLSTLAYGAQLEMTEFPHVTPIEEDDDQVPSSMTSWQAPALPPTKRVEDVLGAWDVSAYLCGHLHDTFGLRVHKLHPKPAPAQGVGHMAELLLPDWKLSRWFRAMTIDPEAGMSFADLQFIRDLDDQGDSDEPVQLVSADTTRIVAGHVALITSPPDARYSFLASDPAAPGSAARSSSMLRVLLLPAQPTAALRRTADGQEGVPLVSWICDSGLGIVTQQGSAPMQPDERQPWVYSLDLASIPGLTCNHGLKIQVIVHEAGGTESRSELRPIRSPFQKRPISDEAGMAVSGNTEWAKPQPLGLRLSERIILQVHWAKFGIFAFQLQWVLLMILLLLPRLIGQAIVALHCATYQLCFGQAPTPWGTRDLSTNISHNNSSNLGHAASQNLGHREIALANRESQTGHSSPHTAQGPTHSRSSSFTASQLQGVTSLTVQVASLTGQIFNPPGVMQPSPFSRQSRISAWVMSVFRPFIWTSRVCVAKPLAFATLCVLWPFKDMARLASSHADLWWCLLGYAINLQFGPWFVGKFSSNLEGYSVMTAHGLWLRGPAGYMQHTLHDAPIVTNVHMATAILPTIVWLTSVVIFWTDMAASSKLQAARLLTWQHIVALFIVVPIHCRLMAKMAVFYGLPAILLAPATGWLIPLACLWLRHARNTVSKSRRD